VICAAEPETLGVASAISACARAREFLLAARATRSLAVEACGLRWQSAASMAFETHRKALRAGLPWIVVALALLAAQP
jgi:hypothetical protein